MIVAIGADHAGYPLKPRDYPDYARLVGTAIAHRNANRGVLVCGSGVGAAVAACKIPGVRASVAHDTFSARQGVEDDDVNVLALGARVIGPELAAEVTTAFLAARFSDADRHARRVAKVIEIERDALAGEFDR
jgi:ribose 5-phosphate isomerase B